jgi:hypothetical protein
MYAANAASCMAPMPLAANTTAPCCTPEIYFFMKIPKLLQAQYAYTDFGLSLYTAAFMKSTSDFNVIKLFRAFYEFL